MLSTQFVALYKPCKPKPKQVLIDFTHIIQAYISWQWSNPEEYIDGLVQDCSNSIANAMELL